MQSIKGMQTQTKWWTKIRNLKQKSNSREKIADEEQTYSPEFVPCRFEATRQLSKHLSPHYETALSAYISRAGINPTRHVPLRPSTMRSFAMRSNSTDKRKTETFRWNRRRTSLQWRDSWAKIPGTGSSRSTKKPSWREASAFPRPWRCGGRCGEGGKAWTDRDGGKKRPRRRWFPCREGRMKGSAEERIG